ncbi:GL13082 [Drosophila persimilis]|uniref:Protein obstructor-E n=2 Tax=pseudoobscura subgroup TaxID=32358 RepID=Q29GW4_DROPS|nr:protein obstructor-E [Drosophila pseudoobscura]XP_002022528.1 protein obstructor-E [Drosophila persimilis]XP_017156612.1 protein obstructor-E [Drosophila miranda]EDW26563.1 GL13082 [Drosophila persimilis]
MKLFLCAIAVTLCLAGTTVSAAGFECPKPNGQFADEIQCDKFHVCEDGVPKARLCPDGLVFDPLNRKFNKCDQPFNVDCEDRTELQEPKSSKYCPRKNGFFAHPDPAVCNIFYNCIEGDALETKCTVGLHFDEYSGTCVWPDTAKREGCNPEQRMSETGFECPKDQPKTDDRGQVVTHPKYPHPTDCQKFYVCLNGEDPRDLGCQLGEVYNDNTEMCDAPENVPGCEDWYKDVDDKKD